MTELFVFSSICQMTGTQGLWGNPVVAANTIKDEIYHKLLAKMASDFKKPNLVHTLFLRQIQEKMWPLSVRELFFVGAASEQKLHKLGIMTIGDLAQADVNVLKLVLKKHGETIWNFANGRDVSLVETVGRRLWKDEVRIEVVAISIRFDNFKFVSHQCVLQAAPH